MFQKVEQTIDVDGEQLPLASLLRRGTVIAVDLTLTVAAASIFFGLISLIMPLDGQAARMPIMGVMLGVLVYLVWGRDYAGSLGRAMFRLRVARMPGPVPGLFGRKVAVHCDMPPVITNRQTLSAVVVIFASSSLAAAMLGVALTTTHVFKVVERYAQNSTSLANQLGASPTLSNVPRALLIGKERSYVQISAIWSDSAGVLEFFLIRDGRDWDVVHARQIEGSMLANYALAIQDDEIPHPPTP
ncbi:MAG: hypothetical protein HOI95_02530 [Chromatiales bacterium]|nr:hypothetical protein [Chromatiales bacterium]